MEIFVAVLVSVLISAGVLNWRMSELKRKIQNLEIRLDALTNAFAEQSAKPQYNEAIDPNPGTPEEHDYLVRLQKEGEL